MLNQCQTIKHVKVIKSLTIQSLTELTKEFSLKLQNVVGEIFHKRRVGQFVHFPNVEKDPLSSRKTRERSWASIIEASLRPHGGRCHSWGVAPTHSNLSS